MLRVLMNSKQRNYQMVYNDVCEVCIKLRNLKQIIYKNGSTYREV